MQNKVKAICFLLLTVLPLILTACETEKVNFPVTRPAEINLKNLKTIAIGEITGQANAAFTNEITEALFQSKRFDVVDRVNIERITREHNLNLSGMVDSSTATELSKLIGAAALIFGNISEYRYNENIESRTGGFFDKLLGEKDPEKHTYYTRKGTAQVGITLQVVDLTTGKIIAAKKLTESLDSTTTSKDNPYPPLIDSEALFSKVRQRIISNFVKMIAPYTEMVAIEFAIDDKIPELQQGVNFIKVGNWEQGIKIFKAAIDKYEAAPNPEVKIEKLYYNLGLAYEYTNQFDEADALLNKAFMLNQDDKYGNEIKNLRKLMEERRRLEEQTKY